MLWLPAKNIGLKKMRNINFEIKIAGDKITKSMDMDMYNVDYSVICDIMTAAPGLTINNLVIAISHGAFSYHKEKRV